MGALGEHLYEKNVIVLGFFGNQLCVKDFQGVLTFEGLSLKVKKKKKREKKINLLDVFTVVF